MTKYQYIEVPCPCVGPGWCPHYGITLTGYHWDVSRRLDEVGRRNRLLWTQIQNPDAKPAPAVSGPGTELTALLASLGIAPLSNCPCKARACQMDAWGPAGCREHRAVIIGWLNESWNWKAAAGAARQAVVSGLATRLNPLDPVGSLVDEAIRRAEAKT